MPSGPRSPCAPVAPKGPGSPFGPGGPCGPIGPGVPVSVGSRGATGPSAGRGSMKMAGNSEVHVLILDDGAVADVDLFGHLRLEGRVDQRLESGADSRRRDRIAGQRQLDHLAMGDPAGALGAIQRNAGGVVGHGPTRDPSPRPENRGRTSARTPR